jgi:ketosteroid isomerase-like protein
VTDDLAVAHALVTFRGLSAEGDELRAMNNRLTWVLERRSGEAWRIVHEHTSAPADFETAKLILQR